MSPRILLVVALAVFGAAELSARSPFRWLRSNRRPATPNRTQDIVSRDILASPEKMTERFGPSILVRDQRATEQNSRFVKQP